MADMKVHDAEENKREEQKWTIEGCPYFAFSVKPAKIIEQSKA